MSRRWSASSSTMSIFSSGTNSVSIISRPIVWAHWNLNYDTFPCVAKCRRSTSYVQAAHLQAAQCEAGQTLRFVSPAAFILGKMVVRILMDRQPIARAGHHRLQELLGVG